MNGNSKNEPRQRHRGKKASRAKWARKEEVPSKLPCCSLGLLKAFYSSRPGCRPSGVWLINFFFTNFNISSAFGIQDTVLSYNPSGLHSQTHRPGAVKGLGLPYTGVATLRTHWWIWYEIKDHGSNFQCLKHKPCPFFVKKSIWCAQIELFSLMLSLLVVLVGQSWGTAFHPLLWGVATVLGMDGTRANPRKS